MKTGSSPSSGSRFAFLDNLRIYLTILVILHHTALAFGGSGGWPVDDPNADLLSEVVFTFFNAVNQTYFMSLFFLMAGYFTPRSLEKKGPRSYLLDRLIRLGIPLLVYTTLIINLNIYIVQVLWLGQPMTWVWEYNPGHLWFLQALFIFAVIYVIYRLILYKDPTASRWHIYLDRFPPDRVLLVCIAVLSVLTFLVRLAAPIGEWFFGLQLAHFSHYVFCFFVGILFYRGEWFSKLQRPQAKRWGIVALVTIPFFFVLLVLGGVLEGEEQLAKFMGGMYWQSFALSIWETILLFSISIFLFYFFRERVNMRTPLLALMAGSVYTVYIIHQTIVTWVDTWFIPLDLHMFVKFACVSLISIPLCFFLAFLLLRIPGVKRVVG